MVGRRNEQIATEATMIQAAAAAVLSPKDGGNLFRKLVNKLLGK